MCQAGTSRGAHHSISLILTKCVCVCVCLCAPRVCICLFLWVSRCARSHRINVLRVHAVRLETLFAAFTTQSPQVFAQWSCSST